MNIEQAKQIPIEVILERYGYGPGHSSRGQLWYQSPFRKENTPSFKVNPARNLWYDFGDGSHGDAIDLVMQLEHVTNVRDALASFTRLFGSDYIPPDRPSFDISKEPAKLTLLDLRPVKSRALLAYLQSRGISKAVISDSLKEAWYKTEQGREYFALAFANDSGGYELRNRIVKLTLGTKDIATIRRDGSVGYVFEGFFDYLTARTLDIIPQDASVIVLNSVALAERAIRTLRSLPVTRVELFRDNDAAGEKLLQQFQTELPDVTINDQAARYQGHEDLNHWHQSTRPSRRYS